MSLISCILFCMMCVTIHSCPDDKVNICSCKNLHPSLSSFQSTEQRFLCIHVWTKQSVIRIKKITVVEEVNWSLFWREMSQMLLSRAPNCLDLAEIKPWTKSFLQSTTQKCCNPSCAFGYPRVFFGSSSADWAPHRWSPAYLVTWVLVLKSRERMDFSTSMHPMYWKTKGEMKMIIYAMSCDRRNSNNAFKETRENMTFTLWSNSDPHRGLLSPPAGNSRQEKAS